ncbi:MAG: ATP-binding protein [Acidiferrobacter sp.]
MSASQQAGLFAREQFRVTRLQVFNWGTFSGRHDIPIAERGFLFVGRSGSGKSTLLDAFSALLIPPRWVDFNAAAGEAGRGRDRSLVSYVRGAWAEQKDEGSGEIATRYLRTGTTWSALALSYRTVSGQYVTLVQVFWLRGHGNGPTDIRRHYLVLERPFALAELEDFGASNFDVRRLRHRWAEAFTTDEFPAYRERFCRRLGIDSEGALRLLQKTQSAKNLGDLNTFLRDFMLDRPETFAAADRLVAEFGELNAAHQAVVTAREQVEVLTPARMTYEHLQTQQAERHALQAWQEAINPYREARRSVLLEEALAACAVRTQGLQGEIARGQATLANHRAHLHDLEIAHQAAGGAAITQWQTEKAALEEQRAERLRKRAQAAAACQALGYPLPDSPLRFAERLAQARTEAEGFAERSRAIRNQQFACADQRRTAEEAFAQAVKEVEALRRQPTNIPADMLALRATLAQALQMADEALPFVGELLEVKPEEARWSGAIERVLHGFALSLLIDERHYPALAAHINATHLGRRLVYYRTTRTEAAPARPLSASSLVLKLKVSDGPHQSWLQAELRTRFDYPCVDSLTALRSAERAVTVEGQVKHNRDRHEKDDRRAVDDRRYWILGADNRAKRALYEAQAQALGETIAGLSAQLTALAAQDEAAASRALHARTLSDLQWQEIDVAPILERIAALDQQLAAAASDNDTLRTLTAQLTAQRAQVEVAQQALHDVTVDARESERQYAVYEQQRARLAADGHPPLPPTTVAALDQRFAAVGTVTLTQLDAATTTVVQALGREQEIVHAAISADTAAIETAFAEFARRWPMAAGDVDTTLASAPDFLAQLRRLETDGLPAHEARFFNLLENQSHQNLAALLSHLNDARKAILERMTLVNDSLAQVPFNTGADLRTTLHIHVSDRQLPEVRTFRQEIQQALSHAWSGERELAEQRFLILRGLVERLASEDPPTRRWREAVLDVRQHVEFIGRETDEGGVEIEVYRSGTGKSGGQRQKLATTCLAAALRYQLGGDDHGVPIYAPVVLDEAFDKADNEFTALAMNIFANFGFQMIVATPLKSVMTLEPFIGGAGFVDISERKISTILLIEYDHEGQRLRLPEPVRTETTTADP